jgi:hypothetical protein
MTFYEDLSTYTYHDSAFYRPGTNNVGWLGLGHEFERAELPNELLNIVWTFCRKSFAQTRGIHQCEFCNDDSSYAERDGERLLLGTSEIRVFSPTQEIYAAPTLIYHYMKSHFYKPPDQFIAAIKQGPSPESPEYLARLKELSLKWNNTFAPRAKLKPERPL